ncbi:transmembrane protein adipocyte-associated 1 homolog isoform X1 [Fopius arisanus]|uniref:Tpra1_0 protein n=1 Tax=Fopius arisanus TaxID=64838 RepID=A0A0C9REN0_9HYME|nr:PREDICTED: transmembrane protein adipocyte-associated 1 homolog isoform X1 [Fopius arisanus]XP_011310191.1 PREDICTED: transmembrane protein adipocyte-associated 1 homolog isoform X1 [Fopius arisanus]XP_011310192.1 PREDICTED: transmembrane protein adipocyte-associated 1 homolog isoform X1 [Fopius arisanus]XP_011310193.1 PREDICTED: transmembrane protein adipocyte-associated 1 homolog isoform X1 [Fopius arisanus]
MYGGGEQTVSEPWRKALDLGTTADPNANASSDDDDHFCKLVLYKEIQDSRVRIWDLVILIPNLVFLLFIIVRSNRARLKLRATSSPIYLAFYGLVICNVVISVIRCVVSMTVNAATDVGGKVDKVLWVTVRFFLLSTEMSVVIFGLAFGHLDSRSSIQRVLLATSLISLAFTITQGTLELVLPDDTFHIPSRDFYVFGHGGMMFWFCSSLVFTLIYLFILILPRTRLRERLNLPTKKSFYIYVGTLAALNMIQSIGAGLLNYTQNSAGLCVVDLTAALYLTFFTPLVYHTFLSEVFGVSQPSIQFSYKAQVDDGMEEDTVSLPHQQSFSSLKTDSDYIYQVHTPSMHIPLYQSLRAKPPPALKQRTSLYSLSSRMDPRNPHTSRYSSQTTLYALSPEARKLRQRSSQMSVADIADQGANLVLSPSTASNFMYTPKDNDSSANLFTESDRSSLENTLSTLSADASDSSRHTSLRMTAQAKLSIKSPSTSVLPPLENSLQNILDSENDSSSRAMPRLPRSLSSGRSVKSLDVEIGRNIPSTSACDSSKREGESSRDRDVGRDIGGLGDYLQSIQSPVYQSPLARRDKDDSHSPIV